MAIVKVRSHVAPRTITFSAQGIRGAHERVFKRVGLRDLITIITTFRLSPRAVGELLGGVSRQAVNQWMIAGVPTERVPDVARIADVARRLRATIKPERIPAIISRPNPGLGGESVLDVLRAGRPGDVMRALDRLESWVPGGVEPDVA
ncbi:MAG: hypothetical protein JO036_05505 [Candidatus Eremiobacteraeota bacterium]|nr:hypothetical protein [Candidatus Eremiobacteraeota bacterium]